MNKVTQANTKKDSALGRSGDQPLLLVSDIRRCKLEVNSTAEPCKKNSRSCGAYTQTHYALCDHANISKDSSGETAALLRKHKSKCNAYSILALPQANDLSTTRHHCHMKIR
jgi:hypothetical protein